MNRKQLLLSILILFLIAHLINSGYSAFASKAHAGGWEHLKHYNISFSIKADLNNDGQVELVSIFRQWDGEGWYSDDQWYVISIFDEDYNIIYETDVSYFQEVESFSVKDSDGDGLKEIIVSLDPTKYWSPKTCAYGWKDGAYGVISEKAL